MGERRIDLGDVDRTGVATGGGRGRRRRRRRRGQIAGAQHRRLDAVLDAGDPGRVLPQFAGPVAGGQHDRRRAVGDRRDVVAAQRIGEVRPRRAVRRCFRRVSPNRRARRPRRSPAPPAPSARRSTCRVQAEAGLQAGGRYGIGHQRCHRVRVGLQRKHPAQHARAGLAEAVDQRGVDRTGEDLDVGLIERPCSVHLDVRFVDRRDGADRVDRREERERPPGKVIRGSRAPEPDVGLLDAEVGVQLGEASASASRRRWWCLRCGAHAGHAQSRQQLLQSRKKNPHWWCL